MMTTLALTFSLFVAAAACVGGHPVPATAAERAAFTSLLRPATPQAQRDWKLSQWAVVGSYAFVGYNTHYMGGTAILRRVGRSHWRVLERGGGQLGVDDIKRLAPEMCPSTAQALSDLAVSQDK